MSDIVHDDHPRTLTILFATETGTAQEIADRVAMQCRRIHVQARILSMDSYSPAELISEKMVIFSVATTGSGKEPRAMSRLWNMLLRSDLPEDLFEDLSFAVFGLGDTAYEKFCWPAKLLSRRLASLGATEISARGEGDEQHPLGVDGAFEPWVKKLIESLVQIFPLPPGTSTTPEDALPPPRVSVSKADPLEIEPPDQILLGDETYASAIVSCNRRITADDWYQDVRHFEFDFDIDIQYKPGDVALIHPEASPADVEDVLNTLGFANAADDPMTIRHVLEDQSLPNHLPRVTTLRTLFTRYLDISAVPRRSFFAMLRHFVSDKLEEEKLDEFLSPEGADELYDYCQKPRRTIREVLEEFRSARIPREYIFDVFPILRPRQFSIASSMKRHPRQIHLCIAIVRYKTMLKVPRRGVCTDYLVHLKPGDRLPIGLQKGLFALPPDTATPIICVGPGTGAAPMRSIIEERTFLGSIANTLYFGCRSAHKDQHYATEWEAYVVAGSLTYRPAFSRDEPEGAPRRYVQDLIREDSKRTWELLGVQRGWIYISGSANKMPAGVKAAIMHAAQTEGAKTKEQAQDFVWMLEREGRLVEECWS